MIRRESYLHVISEHLTDKELLTFQQGENVTYKDDFMLILDNSTRWNSTYHSIQRGLLLRDAVESYLLHHGGALADNKLSDEDWQQLADIAEVLKPFDDVTVEIQGGGTNGAHGVVWKALTSIDYLLTTLEKKRDALSTQQDHANRQLRGRQVSKPNPILVACQNAWQKLREYYSLTDMNHEIYAAGALLNPCLRKAYFKSRWTDDAAEYIEPMIAANRTLWENKYRQNVPEPVPQEYRSPLDRFLAGTQHPRSMNYDEFEHYINGPQTPWRKWRDNNIFQWWQPSPYPTLRQWAFDTLSIPECRPR